MSSDVINALADQLALAALQAMDETGDERLFEDVARELGKSSPTLEEAFMNLIRIRLTAQRGLDLIERLRESAASPPASKA